MVRSEKYKYTHYLEGNGEELYDLENDPGEKTNLAYDIHKDRTRKTKTVLEYHRNLLFEHCKKTGDDYYNLKVKVVPRWRSHKPGYNNHQGPSAPMVE